MSTAVGGTGAVGEGASWVVGALSRRSNAAEVGTRVGAGESTAVEAVQWLTDAGITQVGLRWSSERSAVDSRYWLAEPVLFGTWTKRGAIVGVVGRLVAIALIDMLTIIVSIGVWAKSNAVVVTAGWWSSKSTCVISAGCGLDITMLVGISLIVARLSAFRCICAALRHGQAFWSTIAWINLHGAHRQSHIGATMGVLSSKQSPRLLVVTTNLNSPITSLGEVVTRGIGGCSSIVSSLLNQGVDLMPSGRPACGRTTTGKGALTTRWRTQGLLE